MKVLYRILGLIGLAGLMAFIAIGAALSFGWYNVAASARHSRLVNRVLDESMERSVHEHSRSVKIPSGINLRDPALAIEAADDYREMCLLCHGAPGQKAAFWTAGLYPRAPRLADRQELRWSDTDLYWIIKNGVKDTGMSAFGATHDDRELWALAALTRQLPTMNAKQFEAIGHESKLSAH